MIDASSQSTSTSTSTNTSTNTSTQARASLISAGQPALNKGRTEVAFVLDNVADWQTLAAGVRAGVEVVLLDSTCDGLAQMADWLAHYAPGSVDAIHLLGHGSSGAINLGTLTLTANNLPDHADHLAAIGSALTADADVLLYGCDVGQGSTGAALVEALAQATQADIAASTNLTGAAVKGGDWDLEQQVGTVDAWLPLMADAALAYGDVLASFNLTGATGHGTKIVKQTVGSDEIVLTATNNWRVVNELTELGVDLTDLDVTVATGSSYESKVKISVTGGKLFDLSSFAIGDPGNEGSPLVVTSNKGVVTYTKTVTDAPVDSGSTAKSWLINNLDINATGVEWIELTTSDEGNGYQFGWLFDNFVLNNITAPPVTLSIADVSQAEGNSGDTTTMTFTVTLSAASDQTVTVDYATSDDTAKVSAEDYLAANDTLTFAPGETSKTINVTIAADTFTESDETFTITLSNPTIATISDAFATGTITNDDAVPPTLTTISTLTEATEDTAHAISYATLLAASNYADADIADQKSFRVEAVSTGSLYTDAELTTAVEAETTLLGTDGIWYWKPAANANGTGVNALSAFTVKAYDGTAASTTAVQVKVAVAAVNDAPTLANGTSLPAIDEDVVSLDDEPTYATTYPNEGDDIDDLLESSGFADVDEGATGYYGIAITGNAANATTEGKWQYANDENTQFWQEVGSVLPTEALLVSIGGDSTYLRFVPVANYNGTPGGLTIHAVDNSTAGQALTYTTWDGTTESRSTFNTTTDDATSPVSASGVAWTVVVNAVADTPTITSATYITQTGVLLVTGTDFVKRDGAANDIEISKLKFTGEGAGTYTLTSASDVEITSATSFTITLSGADKTAIDALLNKTGPSANDNTAYNLAALEDWAAGADASVNIADETGNGITATANQLPTITSNNGGDTAAINVAENTTTAVTIVIASDADVGETLTYSISGGVDQDKFSINSTTGILTFASAPNYEVLGDADSNNTYEVTMRVSDGHGGTDSQVITVTVTDVNEAPSAVVLTTALTNQQITENTATTSRIKVADIAITDDALGTNTISLSGADAANFEVDSGVLYLKAGTTLNFEAKASYAVTVSAADSTLNGSTPVTANYTLTVTDINEAPVISSGATGTVAENAATSTVIYQTTATDVDAEQTLSYSLSGSDASLLDINATSGAVTLKTSANFEAKPSYSFNTIATDNGTGTLSATQAVTVSITDVDETPPSDPGPSTPPTTTSTVDGTTVSTTTTTSGGTTTTTQTVAPVTTTRPEDTNTSNPTLADIPLATDTSGSPLLLVSLPVGVGVTSEATTNTNLSLRDQLVNASTSHVPDSAQLTNMISQGIDQFVPSVTDQSQVTVRTITLNTGSGGQYLASNQPITITGITRQEALVIDALALPRGSAIVLNNVDFAAIVGTVSVTGGAGSNFVIGDGNAQSIFLGEDDDILRGGGGDDTVGSAEGNDQIFGDEGDDMVFGGLGNDTLDGGTGTDLAQFAGQFNEYKIHHSFTTQKMTVSDTLANRDDIDTVSNIEQLQFASNAQQSTQSVITTLTPTLTSTQQLHVLQTGDLKYVGKGLDNDTYLISGAMLQAGTEITISDAWGNNRIQLADGLSIKSSLVANTAMKLTLSNNAVVTVLSADKFTYDVGLNLTAEVSNDAIGYLQLINEVLNAKQAAGNGIFSGGATLIGSSVASPVITTFSATNNLLAVHKGMLQYVGKGVGDDTYLLSAGGLQAGTDLTITDASGANSIQLAAGLSIASSKVAADSLKLTMSNGAVVTILSAAQYTYDVGGNVTAGIDNPDVSYGAFVKTTLGLDLPMNGDILNGGAVLIGVVTV